MSPDQIVALTSLLSIMDKLSGWPFGLLFFVTIIGPWLLSIMLAWSYRKRFDEVVEMYENNVKLVEQYAKHADRAERVIESLRDVILLHTQTVSTMSKALEDNQFCPMVRLEKKTPGRIE